MHTQTFTHTVTATATGVQRRFVNYSGGQANATDQVLGISLVDFKAGDAFAAHIIGVAAVESGAAVSVGAFVIPDALGRGIADAGNATNRVGNALNAVTAAGQTLFVMLK